MERVSRRLVCTLLLGLLPAAGALAAIMGVTTAPSVARVAVARTTTVSFTWNVSTSMAGSVTISSATGEFRAPGGALLGTVNKSLSRTVAGPATVSFAEKVLVPADVIERARRDGHDHLFYRRSFTDGVAASGEIKLQIATAKAAAFGLSRVALAFDDGEPVRVVARDSKLRARAELSYTGSGLLRGAWELAGPNPDADKPAWRVLGEVAQTLAGADSATLTSPALPTAQSGFYLVRLQVAEPAADLDLPVIRYFVRQE